jgi:EAL domain-containing protein (putative c-di-GMP-specific phosphodiesterase class I)
MSSLNNIIKVRSGETILSQGDEGHSAYIIESGSVEILVEKDRGLVQSLGTRGEGTIIGEMALIDNQARTATIKAIEDCQLLEISREDFNRRIENADPVIQMMTQVIVSRYRDMLTRAHILNRSDDNIPYEELEKNLVHKANAIAHIKTINDLKEAIENNEMVLHYQPIIDLKTKHICGFEALIRWNHPEKGLIYPDAFIDAAEESGLIIDLTRKVVEESCCALKKFSKYNKNNIDLFMSVNFSAKDFVLSDFKEYIEKHLDKNNLKPEQIHIEITERLLMAQPSDAKNTLQKCKDAGMPISIDDFGTGYSSLSYLHYFPIDILKIDRSFIDIMHKDSSSMELVKSIISLGHNMKMSIIAEGIENEEQSNSLQALNVDKAQGYFFSKPIDENAIIKLLSDTSN